MVFSLFPLTTFAATTTKTTTSTKTTSPVKTTTETKSTASIADTDPFKNIEKSIEDHTPSFLSKSIIYVVEKLETFREGMWQSRYVFYPILFVVLFFVTRFIWRLIF